MYQLYCVACAAECAACRPYTYIGASCGDIVFVGVCVYLHQWAVPFVSSHSVIEVSQCDLIFLYPTLHCHLSLVHHGSR